MFSPRVHWMVALGCFTRCYLLNPQLKLTCSLKPVQLRHNATRQAWQFAREKRPSCEATNVLPSHGTRTLSRTHHRPGILHGQTPMPWPQVPTDPTALARPRDALPGRTAKRRAAQRTQCFPARSGLHAGTETAASQSTSQRAAVIAPHLGFPD